MVILVRCLTPDLSAEDANELLQVPVFLDTTLISTDPLISSGMPSGSIFHYCCILTVENSEH
jgi:hypothetical protein